ncbi:MAG: hypothetical protein WDN69_13525 [Aliidongia sp.]
MPVLVRQPETTLQIVGRDREAWRAAASCYRRATLRLYRERRTNHRPVAGIQADFLGLYIERSRCDIDGETNLDGVGAAYG